MHAPIFAIFDSPADIGIVVVVLLLLFGSSQLPKLARSLGSAQKEFKKGVEEASSDKPADDAKGTAPSEDGSVQPASKEPRGTPAN